MERQPLDGELAADMPAEDADETVSRARLAGGQVMEVKAGNLAAAKDALAAQKASERSPDDEIDPDDFRSVERPE